MITPPACLHFNLAAFARCASLAGLIAISALLLTVSNPASAQNNPVVAKVDGVEIKQSDLDAAEAEIGQQAAVMPAEAKKTYLINYVADLILLPKAAEKKKLGDTEEFKKKLALARNRLLIEALLTQEGKAAVNEAAMRKVYEEAIKQTGEEQEVHARHILVETEDEAKKILADLKKGGDFAAIAKEKSKDPGAAAQGGDLGYFTKDQMVPDFAEVAFKTEKGQLSDPVKTQFGWHIIKVEDKRTKPAPSFEQVKPQIEAYIQQKAQAEMVQKLRSEAKIEIIGKKPDEKPAAPDKK